MALDAARLILALHFAAGLAVGAAYFQTLWWTTQRWHAGGGIGAVIAVMAARFAVLGALLFAASLDGAAPLLVMALGLMVARFAVLRRVRA